MFEDELTYVLSKDSRLEQLILVEKGEIVEDCISVALGGKDAYIRAIGEEEGTFYLTPMWASGRMEITGLSYEPDFDENVRGFARFFNLKIVEIQGSIT